MILKILNKGKRKEFKETHNKNNCFHIAAFNIHDINETSKDIFKNQKIKNKEIYTICLYGDENNMPHFHVLNHKGKTVCCIRLDKPEFYNHEFIHKINNVENDFIDLIISTLKSNVYDEIYKKEYNIYNKLVEEWNCNLDIPKFLVVKRNINTIPNYNLLKKG